MAKRKTFAINKDFQKGFSQVMSAVDGYAGKLRYEIIPLTQIEFDPENPRDLALELVDLPQGPNSNDNQYQRKLAEMEKLKSLAETIKNQGLINPIVVYKNMDKYRLIAGERRCLASQLAGLPDIKANVLDQRPSVLKRSVLQWIENIEREDLSLWERMRNVEKIVQAYQQETGDHEVTASQIRDLLGCSLPHAMNYHAVLQTGNTLLTVAIRENKIKNLEKAALIARVTEEDLLQKVLSAGIAGRSLKELKQMIAADKKHKSTKSSRNNQERRGRQAKRIQLGFTHSGEVVKYIMHHILHHEYYEYWNKNFSKLDWQDYRAVSAAFQEFIQKLETNELEYEII